jgi:hypothetical protein
MSEYSLLEARLRTVNRAVDVYDVLLRSVIDVVPPFPRRV